MKAGKIRPMRAVQGLRPAGWCSTLIFLIFLIFVIFAQRYTRQLAATQEDPTLSDGLQGCLSDRWPEPTGRSTLKVASLYGWPVDRSV